MKNKILSIFLLLAAVHCLIFMIYPAYGLHSLNDRLAWFGVNAYPWWPLNQLGLPVSHRTFLIRPNALGWVWCAFVWIAFYFGLSRWLVWAFFRNRPATEQIEAE